MAREEVCRIPPGIPGVYLLHAYAPAFGGYPVFYVGSSMNIRRRLNEHLVAKARPDIRMITALESVYFSAAPVLPTDLIPGIEAALIEALRPICNYSIPVATLIFVNLPPMSLV